MPSPYFESIPRWAVEECFNFPLDYIVNTPAKQLDYRQILTAASSSAYVTAMLSPRWLLNDGKHNVYSTTCAQLPVEDIRKQLLQGVGLAHRTLGENFTAAVFKLFGSLIGGFLMAETFYQVDAGFYRNIFQQGSLEERNKPYDFKQFYLAMFIGQLEMHYPSNFSGSTGPELCRRLNLGLDETVALVLRVAQMTGRPKLTFTFH